MNTCLMHISDDDKQDLKFLKEILAYADREELREILRKDKVFDRLKGDEIRDHMSVLDKMNNNINMLESSVKYLETQADNHEREVMQLKEDMRSLVLYLSGKEESEHPKNIHDSELYSVQSRRAYW